MRRTLLGLPVPSPGRGDAARAESILGELGGIDLGEAERGWGEEGGERWKDRWEVEVGNRFDEGGGGGGGELKEAEVGVARSEPNSAFMSAKERRKTRGKVEEIASDEFGIDCYKIRT